MASAQGLNMGKSAGLASQPIRRSTRTPPQRSSHQHTTPNFVQVVLQAVTLWSPAFLGAGWTLSSGSSKRCASGVKRQPLAFLLAPALNRAEGLGSAQLLTCTCVILTCTDPCNLFRIFRIVFLKEYLCLQRGARKSLGFASEPLSTQPKIFCLQEVEGGQQWAVLLTKEGHYRIWRRVRFVWHSYEPGFACCPKRWTLLLHPAATSTALPLPTMMLG